MFDNRKLQSSYNHISSPTSRHNRIILGLILFTLLQTKLLVPNVSVLNRFILVMSMFSCLNLK